MFRNFFAGAFIAAGIVIASYMAVSQLINYKQAHRTISVKGLSEKNVLADKARLVVEFSLEGNDKIKLLRKGEEKKELIKQKLLENGYDAAEISLKEISGIRGFRDYPARAEGPHFEFIGVVRVETPDVMKVYNQNMRSVLQNTKGVSKIAANPRYFLSKLNDHKQGMIKEATENGYQTALSLVQHTKHKVGALKKAEQGVFEITTRDDEESYRSAKTTPFLKLRVVCNYDYEID